MGGEEMQEEQRRWAARIREITFEFQVAVGNAGDAAVRHRPAPGEWSAVEVIGHMIDKMGYWSWRVERIAAEERPDLPGYDQDASVREHDYQQANPGALLDELVAACDRFATIVEALPDEALDREGIHSEYGPITARRCIEMPLGSVAPHLEQLRAALTSA